MTTSSKRWFPYSLHEGRLSAKQFAKGFLVLVGIVLPIGVAIGFAMAILGIEETSIKQRLFELVLLIPLTIILFSLTIRRLHDLDKSGWYALVLFVPVVQVVLVIWLLYKSGTQNQNKFGVPPDERSAKEILLNRTQFTTRA